MSARSTVSLKASCSMTHRPQPSGAGPHPARGEARPQDSPFYYYVMELGDDARTGVHITPDEYIPRTLQTDKKFSGNKPLPLDYCLEVGSQLAHALLYLHSKNLTHRDIKPANVIFVNGRPKLADIGLVAHLDQRSFVGTEGFIPPTAPAPGGRTFTRWPRFYMKSARERTAWIFPRFRMICRKAPCARSGRRSTPSSARRRNPAWRSAPLIPRKSWQEKIDVLRGYEVPTRFRLQKKKKRRKLRRTPPAAGRRRRGSPDRLLGGPVAQQ